MTPLFSYLLQSTIASAICYLFYQLVLRRNTFYKWNRLYFISAIFISALFPALHLNNLFQDHAALPALVQYIPDLNFTNKIVEPVFSWPSLAINIFYAGVFMMFVRFAIQMFSILLIRKEANTQKLNGISIVNTKENISPFSFFNEIYINPQQHTQAEMEQIVCHEMIHAKQYHSADILLSEIFTIIFWFNPFAWLIKKSLKQNLEFLTDRQVLATGIDARLYQYCLLKVSGIHTNMAAASHFNFSKLKNRIIMMNKQKSSQLNVFKYLLLVPVAAFLLMAFNGSVKNMRSGVQNIISTDTVPDPPPPPLPPDADVNIPALAPGDVLIEMPDSVKNTYRQNEAVKIITPKSGGEVVVTLKNGKTEIYDLNDENNRKIFEKKYGKLVPPPPPPLPPLSPPPPPLSKQPPTVSVPVDANSASGFGQLATVKEVNSAKPVYYLDGKIVSSIESVHPNDIASVEVYKGQAADIKYGAGAGKNGVVAITSKRVQPSVASTSSGSIVNSTQLTSVTNTRSGVIVNSTQPTSVTSTRSGVIVKSTQPASATSTTQGIIVNSNNVVAAENVKAPGNPDVVITQNNDRILADERMAKALYYVDGKEVTRKIALALDPAKINQMNVYKSSDAVKKFGEKGRNGIIEISTK